MSLRARLVGTLRALRWAGWQTIKAGAVLITAAVIFHIAFGLPTGADSGSPDVAASGSTATDSAESEPLLELNREKVETEFVQLLNAERRQRGLQTLQERDELQKLGREHAKNMAQHGYVGHDQPGPGGTIRDRYRERGLLPECRLRTGDGRYYPGTENAWGGDTTDPVADAERALARDMFAAWMGSKGHRKAMLVASADEVGLGIAVGEAGSVYAALELC